MPGTHCAMIGCGNGSYHIERWFGKQCEKHMCLYGTAGICDCKPPFKLFTFPTENKDPDGRKDWLKMVRTLFLNNTKLTFHLLRHKPGTKR